MGEETNGDPPVFLTFDDGGITGATTAAPILEEFEYPGHYFFITDRIGDSGFVSSDDVEDLAS